jgi:hypothetical protein
MNDGGIGYLVFSIWYLAKPAGRMAQLAIAGQGRCSLVFGKILCVWNKAPIVTPGEPGRAIAGSNMPNTNYQLPNTKYHLTKNSWR